MPAVSETPRTMRCVPLPSCAGVIVTAKRDATATTQRELYQRMHISLLISRRACSARTPRLYEGPSLRGFAFLERIAFHIEDRPCHILFRIEKHLPTMLCPHRPVIRGPQTCCF